MTALEQLNAYFGALERRFRFLLLSRGAALSAAAALLLTVLLAWVGDRFAFADRAVLPLRILLYAAVAAAIVLALVVPFRRLTRRWVARQVEQRAPGFEQRLLTLTEGDGAGSDNAFRELLAEDSLSVARQYSPDDVAPNRVVFAAAASAAVAAGILLWLILAAPGFLGYGASMLWAGAPRSSMGPLYRLDVSPGDKTVRRKSDQLITAQLTGFSADTVKLHVKYKDSTKWEQAPMQAQPGVSSYGFLIAGLADSLEYYVEAGRASSPHYRLTAKDIAGVERVRVAINPPSYLGLREVVNDPGGDIRTVEGSEAKISVLTDRPLEHGVLVFEDGHELPLNREHGLARLSQAEEGNWLSASLQIAKDASYHVAAVESGERIRISDDYFIESKRDEAPTVRLSRLDSRVSPIEELPVAVEASDDFGLNSLELHYSVNGGPDQKVPLLPSSGVKQANGKTLLYLEDFHLSPGDLVSMYAEAKDARQTTRTDMAFIQAEPFDLTFRQSQAAGGSGAGQGNESEQISEKQKQVIAATWNQSRDSSRDRNAASENARFLSEMENKIGEQAKTLSERMHNRELSSAGSRFADFSKEMDRAAEEIRKAAEQLKRQRFEDALGPEERALQSFLRADSMFRDIQVAFGQRGGGGQGSAGRDLARMLDLELDTDKNQYETGESAGCGDCGAQKQIDEMLQRLKMLAARQQELAAQRQPEHAFEQRYEQEMLRREAEQLQRQLEQLQNGTRQQSSLQRPGQQGGQSGQGSQGGQTSSSSGGQSGEANSSSSARAGRQNAPQDTPQNASTRQSLQQAMDALRQAEEEMRKAVSEHDPGAMRRAGDKLAEAESLMAGIEKQLAGNSVGDVAARAQQLARAQSDFANRLDQAFPGEPAPGFTPFSDGPRARFTRGPFERPTTPQIGALASEKERLAQQVEQLEQQIRDRANALSGGQPGVSRQMRSALSDAEQQDLAMHMKKNADWIRRGWGTQVKKDEAAMAGSLNDLAERLAQAQAAAKEGAQPGDAQAAQAERTLRQLEQLREQLENQAARASAQGPGGGQLNNARSGGQAGGPRSVVPTGDASGPRTGGGALGLPQQPGDDGTRPRDGRDLEGQGGYDPRAVEEALRQLGGLRPRDNRGDYASAWNDVNGVLGDLQRLGQADPGVLAARLNQEVLPAIERLELQLKRQAGNDSAHATRPDPAPAPYRDAVAEYFRRLSK
jgi:hypothetical protein